MRSMAASRFKSICLAVLDDVSVKGVSVTITKHGRPVAQLVPAARQNRRYAQDEILGSVLIVGDIVSPVLPPEAWEANIALPNAPLPARRGRRNARVKSKQ